MKQNNHSTLRLFDPLIKNINMLNSENCLLLIIDVQEKLVSMLDKNIVTERVFALARAAKALQIPVLVTEQYPKGLGNTILEVKQNFSPDTKVFEKTSFSALREEGFSELLKSYNKKQVVVCGIETHICVHQTVADLISEGYEVFVVKDACASRRKYEFKQGIDIMQSNGARISCLEIVLFEWLKDAKNPCFKEIQALIK